MEVAGRRDGWETILCKYFRLNADETLPYLGNATSRPTKMKNNDKFRCQFLLGCANYDVRSVFPSRARRAGYKRAVSAVSAVSCRCQMDMRVIGHDDVARICAGAECFVWQHSAAISELLERP